MPDPKRPTHALVNSAAQHRHLLGTSSHPHLTRAPPPPQHPQHPQQQQQQLLLQQQLRQGQGPYGVQSSGHTITTGIRGGAQTGVQAGAHVVVQGLAQQGADQSVMALFGQYEKERGQLLEFEQVLQSECGGVLECGLADTCVATAGRWWWCGGLPTPSIFAPVHPAPYK